MSMKTSLQRDLDKFFKSVNQADFNIRAVTKGAFSTARSKLNPEAFKRLNTVAVDTLLPGSGQYSFFSYLFDALRCIQQSNDRLTDSVVFSK